MPLFYKLESFVLYCFCSHLLSSSWHFNSHVRNVPQMFFDPQFLEAMYICMGFVPWELLLYNWMKRCYYVPSFPRVYFSLRPFNLHKTIPHFQPNETCDQAFHRGSKQKRRVCFDLQFYILQFNCASHSAFFIIAFSFSGSLLGSLLKCFFFF